MSNFTQNWNVSTNCINNPQYKFHTNLWWNQVVPCKWTDRHGKASSHFSQLFNGGLKIDDNHHEWEQILGIFLMKYQAWLGTLFNLLPSLPLKSALFSHSLYAFMAWCYDILETFPFSFLHIYDGLDYCHMCSTMELTYSQAYQLCTQLSVVFPVDRWNQTFLWLFHLDLETLHGRTDAALVLERNTSIFEASTVNNFQILHETLLYRVKITYLVTERKYEVFRRNLTQWKIVHRNGSVYCIIIYVYNLCWLSESSKHVKENRCCRFFPEHFFFR